MKQLKDGYVIDVPYPTFVHRQAMPHWLNLVVKQQGFQAPDLRKPFRYLELGCAMGIHLHLTAAAHPQGEFVGVDFNAQQLLVAQEGLARTQINNLKFIQASFSDLLAQELEPFDFIVTHGVWSWITAEHQASIVNIVSQLLKPNGLFYCSYMSHPGATHFTAVQKLMVEMARNLTGDSASKASQTLHFARCLAQTQVGLFAKVPTLAQDLAELAKDKPSYVAHDFLAEHWQPQHSADMIRLMGGQGLTYSAGAGIMENMDVLSFSPDVRKMLDGLPLITLRETSKDILRNTLQRQDIYIKQRQKMTEQQQDEFDQHEKWMLLPHAPVGQSLAQDEKLGKIEDLVPLFQQILIYLSQQPMSTHQLLLRSQLNISLKQLNEILMVLVWAGYVHPAAQQKDLAQAALTNTWMQEQALPWRVHAESATTIQV
jgi:ubiquinone/menaquinone biosynthesis C-methylase UbiE